MVYFVGMMSVGKWLAVGIVGVAGFGCGTPFEPNPNYVPPEVSGKCRDYGLDHDAMTELLYLARLDRDAGIGERESVESFEDTCDAAAAIGHELGAPIDPRLIHLWSQCRECAITAVRYVYDE